MFEKEICAILNDDLYYIIVISIGIIWSLHMLYRFFQSEYEISVLNRIENKNLTRDQYAKRKDLDEDSTAYMCFLCMPIIMYLYIVYGCYLRGLEEKLWEHLDLLEKVWAPPNDWKIYSLTKECT